MSKVNTKDLDRRLKKLIDEFASAQNMRAVGDYVAERIQKRTRLGKGVRDNGATPEPLKKLSDKYVKRRKTADLDSLTSPKKSNLTFTGQMLRALKTLRATRGSVLVGVESSSRRDSDLSNAEVAGFVSKDRPFLNLSKAEQNGVTDFIRKIFDAIIRRS